MPPIPAPDLLLVIDVEATCDAGGSIPRTEMEVIEIGAVLVDGKPLAALADFTTFVRPRRHPRLTPFCTRLTSITQDDVDRAPRFPEALELLQHFLAERVPTFASWGDYDKHQLLQDAGHHRVTLPFGTKDHLNLKRMFAEQLAVNLLPKNDDPVTGEQRKLGVAGALARAGLAFEGTPHRGVDDARNIARLLPWCFGRRTDVVATDSRGRGTRRTR